VIDYAEPLLLARKSLDKLEDQLINKKNPEAAASYARVAGRACFDLSEAIDAIRLRQQQGKQIP
jgi:hypothetical protein